MKGSPVQVRASALQSPANTGYFTKRTADAWLRDVLDEARRGTLPGLVKTDVTWIGSVDRSPATRTKALVLTTMKYLHYAPRETDAALVAEAFKVEGSDDTAKKKTRPTRDRVV
jgi:hypothetical protein